MRILIVSDTHKAHGNLERALEKEGPLDMLIHLGDGEGSDELIASWVNPGCLTEFVLGNNDFFSNKKKASSSRKISMPGYSFNGICSVVNASCVFRKTVQ